MEKILAGYTDVEIIPINAGRGSYYIPPGAGGKVFIQMINETFPDYGSFHIPSSSDSYSNPVQKSQLYAVWGRPHYEYLSENPSILEKLADTSLAIAELREDVEIYKNRINELEFIIKEMSGTSSTASAPPKSRSTVLSVEDDDLPF